MPHVDYILLSTLTVLSISLRFYGLGEWSFWRDEMFTVGGREDGFNYSWARQSLSQVGIQYVIAWLGVNEWNARLVPALIGALTIPILYFPLRRIWGTAIALIAALLLTVAPWHLYWSQNARFYVALLLFYALAQLTFFIGLEEDRPAYFWLSLLCLGLAAKERLLALFFLPVAASYLLLLLVLPFKTPPGFRWRNLLLVAAPVLAIGLFFVAPYMRNLSDWMAGFGYANNDPLWLLGGIAFYIGTPLCCVGVAGAIFFIGKRNRSGLYLSLGIGVPIAILLAISPIHYTANRYVFITLTSWIVLASLAMHELFRLLRDRGQLLAAGVLALLLCSALQSNLLYYLYQNGNRPDWKGAFAVVQEQMHPTDKVVSINNELADYYMQSATMPLSRLDLARISEDGETLWVIEDMIAQTLFPEVHQWLEEHAQFIAHRDVHVQARIFTMRVYRYEPARLE